MDQRKNQFQSLGICHRLIKFTMESLTVLALKPFTLGSPVCYVLAICHRLLDFIMQSLAAQAVKPVTLGPSVQRGLARPPHSDASQNAMSGSASDRNVQPMAHGLPCEGKSPRARVESEQAGATETSASGLSHLDKQ
uniref:Uncharacterized protein n=1 Tax=Davidia involucrata TaxID=16924 RepID=A0A5B7BWV5_DAVIN